jgi:hypothetical protein
MVTAPASTAARKLQPTGGKGRSLVWIQGLACGVLAALVPSLALMVAILLGPGLVALALDHEPGKPVARAIILAGLAACVRPVIALWSSGHGWDISMTLISDIGTVGTAWSAAAGAWLLTEIVPIGVRIVLEGAAMARAAQLRSARFKLQEEWGLPPPHNGTP